jgi:SAM-dependent methyltransferase
VTTGAGRQRVRTFLKTIRPLHAAYRRSLALRTYLAFRARLLAASARDLRQRPGPGAGPLPPAKLRYRVSGSLDPASFRQTGRTIAADLQAILREAGRELDSFERVLDFGCGCGRVIQELVATPGRTQFFGTDIDRELVGWCQRHIPDVDWAVNAHQPPLTYPDDRFDLIYAVSVFTHLDERMQDLWLAELSRVAQPGGLLILTVLGEASINKLGEAKRTAILERGHGYFTGTTGRLKLDGLPDFYQIAYHAPDYVRRHWTRWFEIVAHVPRAINDHQDAIVVRKPVAAA